MIGIVPVIPIVVPAVFFFGLSLFMTYPALFSLISEATGTTVRGRIFGIIFGAQLLGGATVIYLSGILAEIYEDIRIPFIIVGLLSIIVLGQIWVSKNIGTVTSKNKSLS
jgi:MFS family permease